MKNLIIDGQILQTSAWHRGMGKYMLQVLRQLSEIANKDLRIAIIFNDSLATDSERYDTISFLCPNIEQIHCELPLPPEGDKKFPEQYKRILSQVIVDRFQTGTNYFLISALFFFDFYAEFPENCHKLLLFYDLTPLLFWKDLGGYFPPNLYLQRFERVLEAETIFAISETTRRDLIKTLGLEPDTVININGGFTKVAESARKPASFTVPEKYILFPTGDLPHKNNLLAVKGYKAYCDQVKQPLTLLITSRFHDSSKQQLRAISDNIIFTNNVSDEELEWLYQHASAVLFASKYEGLGLPILDAVANDKPVITSQISVFEEMSSTAFYYFQPDDHRALATTIASAVKRTGFAGMQKGYRAVLKKYTWQNTVAGIIAGINKLNTDYPVSSTKPRPQIAVVCIHPGVCDQIGRSAEALHNSLRQPFKIDYYFDANGYHFRDMERPTFLDFFDNKALDIISLNKRSSKKYQAIIYLLDELAFPSRVAQRACVLPGIAVTHFNEPILDDQNTMFKEITLDNQWQSYALPEFSYQNYQALISELQADITKHTN